MESFYKWIKRYYVYRLPNLQNTTVSTIKEIPNNKKRCIKFYKYIHIYVYCKCVLMTDIKKRFVTKSRFFYFIF